MQEIALHLLDIAQNAVAAGARQVEIRVENLVVGDRLVLTVGDDGAGMTGEQARQAVRDPFFTSRTTRSVGLGLPLLLMAAQRTGGTLHIHSAPGKGSLVRAEFVVTSLDCPPLGDMGGTIAALMGCNPDLMIRYTRRRDGRQFSVDTRQLGRALGEASLADVRVIRWVRQYIRENTREMDRPRWPLPRREGWFSSPTEQEVLTEDENNR